MNYTKIVRPWFDRLYKELRSGNLNPVGAQSRELSRLIRRGCATEFGRTHSLRRNMNYEQFRSQVPVTSYADIRPLVMRMIAGESDVLCPGVVRRYAQSSGTSDGKSKYIPISDESLRRNHYKGGSLVVASYMHLHPESRMFDGKGLILGGSYANELTLVDKRVKVGDLSATLIDCINPLVNLARVPSKRVALMKDWEKKLPAIVNAARKENITNISGVPSWFLTVLRRVIEAEGAQTIHDVWPNLEVFFHGGIAFGPYKEQYDRITRPEKMHYLESYNASEGFFAVQTSHDDVAMELLADAGVFFEFAPVQGDTQGDPVPLWEVEKGKIYALVITASNGLWRYPIGDTVQIESIDPVKITIAGRTKSFINAFGEEVMVHNTDAALSHICRELECEVADYTAAPLYADGGHKGRHQWLVEFIKAPADIDEFARRLDKALQDENSDYQAKRTGGIFLDPLSVTEVPRGTFDRWLKTTGKLGGQRKVPRLSNDRHIVEGVLSFLSQS